MNAISKLSGDNGFRWWCPGCESNHVVPTGTSHGWGFNGDYNRPTLSPSVLIYGHPTLIDDSLEGDALTAPENIRESPRCHSFVRDGRIEYLGDCTHSFAGKTVDMVPLP